MKLWLLANFLLFQMIDADRFSDANNLTKTLLANYNKNVRPVYVTEILFEVELNQLINIDEKNQIMTSSFYLKMFWQDPRLTWAKEDFPGVRQLLIPATSIWLPDAFVINTADANGFISFSSLINVIINSDGTIYLIINLSALKTKCSINVAGFPYDHQRCSIIIGSWQYDNSRLIFNASKSYLNLNNYLENPIWKLLNNSFSNIPSTNRFDAIHGLNGTDAMFDFVFLRRSTNYMLNNLLPCFLMNIITLFAFWIPFVQGFGACI